jgi:hypothetical protein
VASYATPNHFISNKICLNQSLTFAQHLHDLILDLLETLLVGVVGGEHVGGARDHGPELLPLRRRQRDAHPEHVDAQRTATLCLRQLELGEQLAAWYFTMKGYEEMRKYEEMRNYE